MPYFYSFSLMVAAINILLPLFGYNTQSFLIILAFAVYYGFALSIMLVESMILAMREETASYNRSAYHRVDTLMGIPVPVVIIGLFRAVLHVVAIIGILHFLHGGDGIRLAFLFILVTIYYMIDRTILKGE